MDEGEEKKRIKMLIIFFFYSAKCCFKYLKTEKERAHKKITAKRWKQEEEGE